MYLFAAAVFLWFATYVRVMFVCVLFVMRSVCFVCCFCCLFFLLVAAFVVICSVCVLFRGGPDPEPLTSESTPQKPPNTLPNLKNSKKTRTPQSNTMLHGCVASSVREQHAVTWLCCFVRTRATQHHAPEEVFCRGLLRSADPQA